MPPCTLSCFPSRLQQLPNKACRTRLHMSPGSASTENPCTLLQGHRQHGQVVQNLWDVAAAGESTGAAQAACMGLPTPLLLPTPVRGNAAPRPQTLPAPGTTSPTLHQQQNKELLLLHQVQQPCINQACGGFSSLFILFLNTTSTQQGLPVVTPPSLAMIEPFVHAAAATAQQVTSIIYCNTAYGCSLFYLSPLNNYLSYIRYFSKELSASEVSLL